MTQHGDDNGADNEGDEQDHHAGFKAQLRHHAKAC